MHKFKDINLDLLKVIACVGVVLLHTEMGGFKETGSWNFSTYLYYLGTYSYILQKVKYILITVLSWTFIVWLFKRDFSVNPIKKLIGSLVQKGYFFQFWFFGALILIYICLPVLKQFLNSKRSYLYFLSVLLVIGLIFELTNIVLQMPIQTYVIQTFRLWTWLFYYILGGFISQFDKNTIKNGFKRWMKVIAVLLLLVSPFILFFIAKTTYHNFFAEYFYDILLVKVVSVGIFLTIFSIVLNENSNKWIIFLSNQTMGIFIIHTYIMKVWEKLFGFNFIGSYLLFAIFTLSVSFIIVGMLMKIPYFNRIVKL